MLDVFMALTDEPDEVLDLVDEHDVVVGTVTREDVAIQGMNLPGFVRGSNVFVVNNKGEVWVPRRAAHKKIAPNGLDYSSGEHVQSGETYAQAALRGMREELNMEANEAGLEYIGKVGPVGAPYFSATFVYRSNATPDYNKDDFVSAEWITPEAFLGRLRAGEAGKKDLPTALELLLKSKK